jgi:hypothetical protein
MEYRLHEWIAKKDLASTSTDQLVSRFKRWLRNKSNSDIQEILMTALIPDDYEEDGEREKLFTRLVETVIGETFRRIGFRVKLMKSKTDTEDVQITTASKTILVDAKTFRLGRSQIAPNVKDFIKLHTFRTWISNYNLLHKKSQAIGGLIVYPSTHEWVRQSQVYKKCSDKETPVVMMPFEVLCYLLKEKRRFKPEDLLELWDYETLYPHPVVTRTDYWQVMTAAIARILRRPLEEVLMELEAFHLFYEEAVLEACRRIRVKIAKVLREVPETIGKMSEAEVRKNLETLLIRTETARLLEADKNIHKNRKIFLPDEISNQMPSLKVSPESDLISCL